LTANIGENKNDACSRIETVEALIGVFTVFAVFCALNTKDRRNNPLRQAMKAVFICAKRRIL
jgi:hypothetical protein